MRDCLVDSIGNASHYGGSLLFVSGEVFHKDYECVGCAVGKSDVCGIIVGYKPAIFIDVSGACLMGYVMPSLLISGAAIRSVPVEQLRIVSHMNSCFSWLSMLSVNSRSTSIATPKGDEWLL